jgi:hypothetical protein
MRQQSAVEWLKEQLTPSISLQQKYIDEIIEQAKEMEKEQHGETFNAGVQWIQYQRDSISGGLEYWDKEPPTSEQYYNETYGGEK